MFMCTCARVCVMCVRIYVHVFARAFMLCVYIGHRDLFKQIIFFFDYTHPMHTNNMYAHR